jgi:hypothetical protein
MLSFGMPLEYGNEPEHEQWALSSPLSPYPGDLPMTASIVLFGFFCKEETTSRREGGKGVKNVLQQ